MKRTRSLIVAVMALCLGIAGAWAQGSVTGTGVGVDGNGRPMPSITVFTGGPLRALTSTDEGGRFRLSVAPNSRVVFRSVGYRANAVTVSNARDNLTISLVLDESSLEE